MDTNGHLDSHSAPTDSVERYMSTFEYSLARQRMEEALFLVSLVRRATGRIRAIPGAIRETFAAAAARRRNCNQHGAANFS
jgi:hypothetical protein